MVFLIRMFLCALLVFSGSIFGMGAGADKLFNWAGLPADVKDRIMDSVPVDPNVAGFLTTQFPSSNDLHARQRYAIAATAYDPSGKYIAVSPYDHQIIIRDAKTGQTHAVLQGGFECVQAIAFHPDGKHILFTANDGVYVCDIARKWITRHIPTILPSFVIAISPDGTKIAAEIPGHHVCTWSFHSGNVLTTHIGHTDSIYSLAFLSDGTLVSGSYDKKLGIHKGATSCFGKFPAAIISVAARASDVIAVGLKDGTIVWGNVEEGKFVSHTTIKGHEKRVSQLAFSPDGQLVSGSHDQTVKLWSPEGILVHASKKHTNRVTTVGFAPDGNGIVCGTWGKKVYTTSLAGINAIRQWVAEGCKPAQASFSFLDKQGKKYNKRVDPLVLRMVVTDLSKQRVQSVSQKAANSGLTARLMRLVIRTSKTAQPSPTLSQKVYGMTLPPAVQAALGLPIHTPVAWEYSQGGDVHRVDDTYNGKDEESDSVY